MKTYRELPGPKVRVRLSQVSALEHVCLTRFYCITCMDVWMCGCVDVWMCGCVDVWMCGCVDSWMHEEE